MKTGDKAAAMSVIAPDAVFVESGTLETRSQYEETTEYQGTFDKSPVNFVSAQLAVLTHNSGNWLIRSIHWSSRRR